MNTIRIKFRFILIVLMVFFLFVVVFVDSNSLNALLSDDEYTLLVDEVNVLNVDYDKVVYVDNSNNNVSTTNNKVSNVSKSVSSNWVWPTNANYVITTYYSSWHKALDISGTGYGSPIYAANNGVVSSVRGGCIPGDTGCNGRGGNYVVINHNNGYYTVYMHLKNINVSVGQAVSAGQVIATMGNTGNVIPVPTSSSSTNGTHLHFCLYKGEPYKGGYEVNPMSLY